MADRGIDLHAEVCATPAATRRMLSSIASPHLTPQAAHGAAHHRLIGDLVRLACRLHRADRYHCGIQRAGLRVTRQIAVRSANAPPLPSDRARDAGLRHGPSGRSTRNSSRPPAAMTGPSCTATVPASPALASCDSRISVPSETAGTARRRARSSPRRRLPRPAGTPDGRCPTRTDRCTSSAAAPSSDVAWPSWPQACITPGFRDA